MALPFASQASRQVGQVSAANRPLISRRALVVGLMAVLVIGIATPYSDLVMRGTWVGLTAFPVNALFVLVALVMAVNTWLHKVGKGLSQSELLVVYAMSLVADDQLLVPGVRRLLPGFPRLVLAEFTAAGLWVVVDFFAGVKGHEVFSF